MMKFNRKPLNKGIYLLPNLFTTSALFAGFYAIVAAMSGLYAEACIAIFIGMIADTLDGRVARMTNTQTQFGAEYDSLADIVSFGVAPALVMYTYSLQSLNKVGWLVCFIFMACAALRLARFNVQSQKQSSHFFMGLPSPAAAGAIVSTIWMCYEWEWVQTDMWSYGFLALTLITGLLMVSGFRYYSFKEIDWSGRVPFIGLFILMLIFVAVALNPPTMLFIIFIGYLLSGFCSGLIRRWRRRYIQKSKVN